MRRRRRSAIKPRSRYYKPRTYSGNRESGKYRRQFILYSIVSLAIIGILWFGGLFVLSHVADFWSFIGMGSSNSDSPQEKLDTIAPSAPYLNPPPESTNKPSISVSGMTEGKAKVVLLRDGNENQDTMAGDDGKFDFQGISIGSSVSLSVIAIDEAGNKSGASRSYLVKYLKDKPEITLDSPKNGDEIKGKANQTIIVSGSVKPVDATVTINDTIALVADDGTFNFKLSLRDNGKNEISIEASDEAGNSTIEKVTVTYDEND